VTVWQRTPPWLLPVPTYQQDLPPGLRWLLRHVPDYARWDRLWVFARTQEGLLPMATVDPAWEPKDRSVSALNEMMRTVLTSVYEVNFPDPVLREKVVPSYPPIAKRVVLDDGTYANALQRDNVTLETTGIAEITERGLRDCHGVEHDYDVIIYGTGFQASKFLTPMRVTGSHGVDLHERWGGDARAYLGITIPGFPNLFLMYGPNTNIVINGSIIYFSECEAHYIVESVRMLLERRKRSMDCRPDRHDAYNERIDAGNRARAWGVSDVNSWYKNEFGRVAQNWPFNLFEYWRQTRVPDPDDYVLR
jgi:4-hydroxyacetophenone monooxygenase